MKRSAFFPFIILFSLVLISYPEPANAQLSAAVNALRAALGAQQFTAVPSHTPSETIKDSLIRPAVAAVAQAAIHEVVNSTINWINNGFDGNPAYVTNPARYFGNVASGVVGEAISDSQLGFLCSPFQAQVKLSLARYYAPETRYQCTLEGIGSNLENFYGNFSEGGWDSWIKMTQNDTSNPYGAFLTAKADIDSRLANTLGIKQQEWESNQGFLSWRECQRRNPDVPEDVRQRYEDGFQDDEVQSYLDQGWIPGKPAGACITEGGIKTPGILIRDKLPDVLGVGLDKLVNAKDIDDLISALLGQLLQKTIFGSEGVFNDDHIELEPPSNTGNDSTGWTFCANEGGTCNFSGAKIVRYGANGIYAGGVQTGPIQCNNATFGDPLPGTAKRCEYQNSSGSDPEDSSLSCSPSSTTVAVYEPVVWTVTSAYSSATSYKWSGDEIVSDPTQSPESLFMAYVESGEKSASITASFDDSDSNSVTVSCSDTVIVTERQP